MTDTRVIRVVYTRIFELYQLQLSFFVDNCNMLNLRFEYRVKDVLLSLQLVVHEDTSICDVYDS